MSSSFTVPSSYFLLPAPGPATLACAVLAIPPNLCFVSGAGSRRKNPARMPERFPLTVESVVESCGKPEGCSPPPCCRPRRRCHRCHRRRRRRHHKVYFFGISIPTGLAFAICWPNRPTEEEKHRVLVIAIPHRIHYHGLCSVHSCRRWHWGKERGGCTTRQDRW